MEGDGVHNDVELLPKLIDGIRLLIYAGVTDTLCTPIVCLVNYFPSVSFTRFALGERALDEEAQEPCFRQIL